MENRWLLRSSPVFQVSWRPALHYVADIDVATLQPHRLDHLRQQFSRPSHKWKTLYILIVSRAFADENKLCARIPIAEDNLISPFAEPAALAVADEFMDSFERVAFNLVQHIKKCTWRNQDPCLRRGLSRGVATLFELENLRASISAPVGHFPLHQVLLDLRQPHQHQILAARRDPNPGPRSSAEVLLIPVAAYLAPCPAREHALRSSSALSRFLSATSCLVI